MTGLTVVTLLVVLAAVSGRLSFAYALAIGAATPAGAALVVGQVVLPTFYAVAASAAAILLLGVLGFGRWNVRQRLPSGGVLFLAFLAWAVMVTLTAPLLFDGLPVVHPLTRALQAGTVTSSNVAQVSYLILGLSAALLLARSRETGPGVLGVALGSILIIDMARYVALQLGLPFPEGFFDSSPNFNYIETAAGGLQRFRGIHSEPSALASACVTGIAYFANRAPQVGGWRRVGCLMLVGAAAWLGVVSTSATFVVAGLLAASIFVSVALMRFAARRTTITLTLGLGVSVMIVAASVLAPTVFSFVQTTINGKLGSSSFGARSSSDELSLGVFLDTYGFGVGLGSARGSSFVPTLLSAVGLVGTLLLAAAIVTVVAGARRDRACYPVVWALLAFLVVKLTSSPDLSGPDATLWLALGILARAASNSGTAGVPRGAVAISPSADSDSGTDAPQLSGDLAAEAPKVGGADQPERPR